LNDVEGHRRARFWQQKTISKPTNSVSLSKNPARLGDLVAFGEIGRSIFG